MSGGSRKSSLFWDYLELCKPRVVILMLLTALVGMCLAVRGWHVPPCTLLSGMTGIALVAGAAAVLNHVADRQIDRLMRRTQYRPVAEGRISTPASLLFSFLLCVTGMFLLIWLVNWLTAMLAFLSLVGYAICYTLFLKHVTPQNIVIGGIAGAAPPLLGWTAVTGTISAHALLPVLIIFVWTPPHFWSLAIHRIEDYASADIPMLPNTHGIPFTRLNILLYTVLLVVVSVLPFVDGLSGDVYLLGVIPFDIIFLYYTVQLYTGRFGSWAIRTFRFSILWLGAVFVLLLADHWVYS